MQGGVPGAWRWRAAAPATHSLTTLLVVVGDLAARGVPADQLGPGRLAPRGVGHVGRALRAAPARRRRRPDRGREPRRGAAQPAAAPRRRRRAAPRRAAPPRRTTAVTRARRFVTWFITRRRTLAAVGLVCLTFRAGGAAGAQTPRLELLAGAEAWQAAPMLNEDRSVGVSTWGVRVRTPRVQGSADLLTADRPGERGLRAELAATLCSQRAPCRTARRRRSAWAGGRPRTCASPSRRAGRPRSGPRLEAAHRRSTCASPWCGPRARTPAW